METININGPRLRTMILTGAKKLELEKTNIDSLNVFPVPDGDTGTNMSLTLASAAKALEALPGEPNIKEVAKAIAYGALMGARGNSGVILSQLLGGFAKAVEKENSLNALSISDGFNKGVEAAYKAVVKPIEGTILTVAREASEKLAASVNEDMEVEEALNIFITQGYKTLALTPEMLPVLKQAGVVDAGGQGFLTFIEGMVLGLKGEDIGSLVNQVKQQHSLASLPVMDFHIREENLQFHYCTELIIKPTSHSVTHESIRDYLEEKGDCVLVVGSDSIIKIHVHTNHPGLVLDYCGNLGSLHDIKIENMAEQSQSFKTIVPKKNIGLIAVSIGEGLNEILRSLGVDIIVTGGQTMNPSTEDFINAINNLEAEEIIILPNNKNIILAAEQAAKIALKSSTVLPSKTVPQGIGALMAFNGELDLQVNVEKMREAIKGIKTGEVTYAVRDAKHGDLLIKEGQFLGLIQGDISYVDEEIDSLILKMMDDLLEDTDELVTLYYGGDVTEGQAETLLNKLSNLFSNIDFELHFGGHPLYYYLISVE